VGISVFKNMLKYLLMHSSYFYISMFTLQGYQNPSFESSLLFSIYHRMQEVYTINLFPQLISVRACIKPTEDFIYIKTSLHCLLFLNFPGYISIYTVRYFPVSRFTWKMYLLEFLWSKHYMYKTTRRHLNVTRWIFISLLT